ncbi:MAG: hypothetical protein IPJ76_04195 [Flavobacteriales bacterium]|nr:MAG: hypothetical protein IPJ76_04195 [Flavobacteriales bacterium]
MKINPWRTVVTAEGQRSLELVRSEWNESRLTLVVEDKSSVKYEIVFDDVICYRASGEQTFTLLEKIEWPEGALFVVSGANWTKPLRMENYAGEHYVVFTYDWVVEVLAKSVAVRTLPRE